VSGRCTLLYAYQCVSFYTVELLAFKKLNGHFNKSSSLMSHESRACIKIGSRSKEVVTPPASTRGCVLTGTHKHTRTHLHTYTHSHALAHIHTLTRTCTHTHTHTHCTHTRTHTHLHTYTHPHALAHIHAQTHTCAAAFSEGLIAPVSINALAKEFVVFFSRLKVNQAVCSFRELQDCLKASILASSASWARACLCMCACLYVCLWFCVCVCEWSKCL